MLFSGTFTVGLFLDVRLVTVTANVPILQILATEMLNTKKYTRSIDLNNAQNLDADCCHSPHDAAVGMLKVAFTATSMFWYSLSLFSVFLGSLWRDVVGSHIWVIRTAAPTIKLIVMTN